MATVEHQQPDSQRYVAIDAFIGVYAFLSNTFHAPALWNGRLYPCAASAVYVAQFELSEEEILMLQEGWKGPTMNDGTKKLLDSTSYKVHLSHM